MSNVKVLAQQAEPRVVSDGDEVPVRATRDGIPFVATWKQALLLEGRCFQFTVGTLPDAAVTTLIRGGGAGGVTDLDQPEFGVSAANGLALIPLDIRISVSSDLGANDNICEALVMADTAAAATLGTTQTTETPINMITDGPGSHAVAFSAATADITDPTCSMILAHEMNRLMAVSDTTGSVDVYLKLNYQPAAPVVLKGPAAFYGFWGGSTRTDGVASVVWGELPEGRFDLS